MVSDAVAGLGRLDIAINNAGTNVIVVRATHGGPMTSLQVANQTVARIW
jgi:NAD(P)-dependent dehydrogenase (short-subunit alcohol dehydrogenase family)